ncbi:hypothetical protein [Paenibacillus arenilitoris]|uniref:Uncharacterized protein n=1 Tax=Paenibacillus arenilitoris TaxID=2772299 RepID=A0A927CJI6_9BACL|nr:hypothetical protein [Paenibacillus arenilitoris]MBD2868620.1 hypothetical protein [Paenibacillus arenilitoris]
MENEQTVKGTGAGAEAAADQPKIVAEMPQDKNLKDPEEAAETDGYPGSCQL